MPKLSPIQYLYMLTTARSDTPVPMLTCAAIRLNCGEGAADIRRSVGAGGVREDDAAALGPNAPGGGLQVADDAEAQPAVAGRRPAGADTLREMGDDPLQGLARLDVRAHDVAGAVADQEPPAAVGVAGEVDAAVVDPPRFGRV